MPFSKYCQSRFLVLMMALVQQLLLLKLIFVNIVVVLLLKEWPICPKTNLFCCLPVAVSSI
jgi:hypothetical protein